MLSWRTITPSNNPKFTVKGTELAQAIVPGTNSRFAIVEVRTIDADRFLSVTYYVRDAKTVSDAEVRDGIKPKIVFRGDLDECLKVATDK